MCNTDIKLFVCCHKEEKVPEHELLYPIQVGTALADKRFPGFLYDNEGENISRKNRSYCELTAQYWAWKNVDAEYYGFFHYRRFLYPDTKEKLPYRIEKTPSKSLLSKLKFDSLSHLVEQYDVIIPVGENMHISVREHYATAPYHHGEDIELVEKIVCEMYPEMSDAVKSYLNGTICYFGNIYIMKRDAFFAYCAWLFSIMDEYDRRKDNSDYTAQELRVNGYLAERLFGIWLTHVREKLCVGELPRVHFMSSSTEYIKNKLINMMLPPGSVIRSAVKSLM